MGEISRRTAITAAAVAAAPIVAAAGRGLEDWFDWFPFFRDEPAEPSSQDATQQPSEPSAQALSATGPVRSYGPNGTHWPATTPRPGDPGVRVIDVDCSWGAIAGAISGASDADVAAGLHVRVARGTLPGHGAGANARPVLKGLGKASWKKNILVSPRDGWGSVTISDPVRIVGVDGVTFARINSRYVLLTDCVRTAWAQAKVSQGVKVTASARSVTACDLYEVVMADAKTDPNDPFSFAAGAGASLRDCVWEGCYIAPVFRELGSSNHIDAAQMSGGGVYRGLTIRDSTLFGALNCALQLGGPKASDPNKGTPYLTLDRVILTSQTTALRVRYTLPGRGISADDRAGHQRERRTRPALREGFLRVRLDVRHEVGHGGAQLRLVRSRRRAEHRRLGRLAVRLDDERLGRGGVRQTHPDSHRRPPALDLALSRRRLRWRAVHMRVTERNVARIALPDPGGVDMAEVDVVHWNPVRPIVSAPLDRVIRVRRPVGNFGDLLGPVVVDRMLASRGIGRDAASRSVLVCSRSGRSCSTREPATPSGARASTARSRPTPIGSHPSTCVRSADRRPATCSPSAASMRRASTAIRRSCSPISIRASASGPRSRATR